MKHSAKIFTATLAMMLFASVGFAQQKQANTIQKKQQIMKIMQDSTMRALMIDQITQNPQMRRQMMQRMISSAQMDSSMMSNRLQQIMNNPQMQQRMQARMAMMQNRMKSGKMGAGSMQGMMNNKTMQNMMPMMCMRMMQGNMIHQQGMMNGYYPMRKKGVTPPDTTNQK